MTKKTRMDIVIIYSKYSNACHKLNFQLYSNKFLKTTQFRYVCIDNPSIRSTIINNLGIQTVPCIAVYRRSSSPDLFQGQAAFEWLEQFIQFAMAKTSMTDMAQPMQSTASSTSSPPTTEPSTTSSTPSTHKVDIMSLAAAMENERKASSVSIANEQGLES